MLKPKYLNTTPIGLQRTYINRAVLHAYRLDNPVGYAFGGAAYGMYEGGVADAISSVFESVGNVVTRAASTAGDIFAGAGREIGNFVGSVARETGTFFSQVGREIGNAAQTVYREVIQPVGKVVEGVAQAIANDPITFVASVAAVASGNAWAVPLIQGASTAAHGGSIEDVLKATAISAATTWVGGQIASGATEFLKDGIAQTGYSLLGQTIEKTTAATIGNVIGYSTSGAIGAAAMGKSGDQILTAALANGAGAAIPYVLGKIPGYNDLVKGTVDGLAPDVSKAIANGISGVAGAVVSSAIANKDMGTAIASSLIVSGINGLVSTKNMVTDLFKQGGEALGVNTLSNETQAIVANTLSSVFATALTGGKAGNVLQQAMMSVGTQALQGYINDGIKQGTAYIKNLYNEASGVQTKYSETMDSYVRNLDIRNDLADRVNEIVDEEAGLADQYDAAQNELDAFLIKSKGYQTQYDQKYALYNQYLNQANTLAGQVNSKGEKANSLAGEVNVSAQRVNDAIQQQKNNIAAYDNTKAQYNDLLAKYNDGNSNAFKNTFNSSWYLQQYPDVAANGTYGADPYRHFIEHGYSENRAAYPGYIGNLDAQASQLRSWADQINNYANTANSWAEKVKTYSNEYNTLNSQYQTALTDYNNTKKTYDDYVGKATSTASTVNQIAGQLNQVNTQINQKVDELKGINDRITTLNNEYTQLDTKIDNYDKTIKQQETTLTNYDNQYKTIADKIEEASKPLTDQINDMTNKITYDLVQELDPDFNADEYKKINGLGDGVDAASHWLSIGKNQGLYTNNAAADASKYEAVYDLATAVAKQRGYASGFEVPNAEWAKLYEDIEKHYGNDIAALKKATPGTFAWETGKPVSQMLSAFDESKLADNAGMKETYGAWNAPEGMAVPKGTKLATAEEYASGKATKVQLKDGNVAYVVSSGTQTTKVYDANTGDMVDVPVGAQAERGPDGKWTITLESDSGAPINILVTGAAGQELPTTLDTVTPEEQDPLEAMYTFNTMDKGLLGDWSKPGDRIIEGSKAIIQWAEEKAKTGESSNVLAIASNVVGGFGEQFQSFAGLAALVGTQPETTDLYKLGQKLIDLQKSSTPADFAKRYEEFQAQYKNVQGIGKGWAFVKAAVNSPSEFLIGMAIPEIAQELIPTLVGVATGGMSKVIGTGTGALAAVAPKVASWVSKWGGVTGAAASDVVESFGANYNDTYKEAKTLAAKAHPEWSQQQIEEYATNQGLTVGMVGALTTGISMGVGGAALAKSLLGPKATDEAVEGMTGWLGQLALKMTTTGKIMLKEGVSEAVVEEMPTQLVKDILFLPMDPNRDIAGNLSLAGAQAFMTAGATTGGISAAHQTAVGFAELALNANDAFINAINGTNGNVGQLNSVLNQWLPAISTPQGQELRDIIVPAIFEEHPNWSLNYATAEDYARTVTTLGVKDPVAITELVDKRFDTAVTTSDELATELYNKGLTDVTIKDVQNVLGTGTQTTTQVSAAAADYVNKNMVSLAEVQAAAKQEGYTATQKEMDALVGRGVEAEVIQKFIQEIDPKAVTTAEATQYFKDLGYTKATAADIAQFVKSSPEVEVQAAIAAWVDPRQVTRKEAINFFAQYGYTPTEAELNQYIVQGPEVVQDTIKKNLEAYVDPRYVSADEVRAAFKNLGLAAPIAAADIARLTGQYAESELAAKAKEAIPVVTANAMYAMMAGDKIATQEVKDSINKKAAEFQKLGLSQADAQIAASDAVASQFGITRANLMTALNTTEENLSFALSPTADAIIKKIEEYQAQGMASDQALQAAVDTVANSLGTTRTDLLKQLNTTEASLKTYVTAQVSSTEKRLADLIAKNESAGMARSEAMQKAIDDLAGDLGTTRTDLLSKIDLTSQQFQNEIQIAKTDIDKQLVAMGSKFENAFGNVKTEIQTQMAAYEKAGIDRDTALSLAISGVAQDLGTTKADLLTKIGTSEATLRNEFTQQTTAIFTQIQDVAKLLGKPASQVTANDVQMVKNMIAGQSQTDLAYDVNQDGKIDINDQTAIEAQLNIQNNPNINQQVDPETGLNIYVDVTTGKPIDAQPPALGGKFTASGIYEELQKQEARQAQIAKAQGQQAKQAQQKNQFGQLMSMIFSAPDAAGQEVTVKTPDPAKIGYIYDWSSIFATPAQASMMPSPYGPMNTVAPQQQKQPANQPMFQMASGFAEGGIVGGNDINVGDGGSVDDLINLLKGNSG